MADTEEEATALLVGAMSATVVGGWNVAVVVAVRPSGHRVLVGSVGPRRGVGA